MDDWGWQELEPLLDAGVALPIGLLFGVVKDALAAADAASGARAELRRTARPSHVRRRFVPHQLRHAHAVEVARERVRVIAILR
jgi:hypothetical protein